MFLPVQLFNGNSHCYISCTVNQKMKELINNDVLINATNVAQNFSSEEMTIATNNFSHLLGQGGFGPVYKGILADGSEVAVKMLSNTSQQGPQQFLNEVFDFFPFRCISFVSVKTQNIRNDPYILWF